MKHSKLTKRVLDLYAKSDETLSKQLEMASYSEEVDEVGYFLNFTFKDEKPIQIKSKKLPDVYGVDKDGKPLVGFVLFVTNGYIETLEAYTYDNEKWPENDDDIYLEIA